MKENGMVEEWSGGMMEYWKNVPGASFSDNDGMVLFCHIVIPMGEETSGIDTKTVLNNVESLLTQFNPFSLHCAC